MNIDIYNTLKDRILYLDYSPGFMLKEQELAEEFGISRTPLRTVLFRLEWEHLLKTLPRTGILVMELELNTLTHVFQARLELESVIGVMAAERFTKDHFSRLEELLEACRGLSDQKNPKALGALDFNIKQLFYDAAANPFLTEISERLYSLTFRLWIFNLLKMNHEDWNIEVDSIREDLVSLSGLLRTGTPKQVGEERKDHLIKHLHRIRSKFLNLSGAL